MNRYHKKIYFPSELEEDLISFTYKLNGLDWQYTRHCLDNIKLRVLDMQQLLYWIKNQVILDYKDIFEYYTDERNNILKVCYRFEYNKSIDIILVISSQKQIITIYYNSADDEHYTLKNTLYAQIKQ